MSSPNRPHLADRHPSKLGPAQDSLFGGGRTAMTDAGLKGRKRGPYAPTLKRRRHIAAAVLDLVDEVGPESVTTIQVAEKSGTPETTVLYHYPTKDDMLVAALELADELGAANAHVDDPEIRLDLEEFARSYRSPSSEDPRFRLSQLVRGLAATPGTSAAEYVHRRTHRQIEIFTRMFEQRKRDGLAHPDVDAGDLARQVIALWEGLELLFAGDLGADSGRLLTDAIRRLSGENWMELRRAIGDAGRGF
ncbi:TetR/AcrR family transcriptional regulator [Microbacterium sp. NPDC019599]|uniref:TetR/AcrR family transcriptional regulator n=1 Tax=Microbacterium sp. NPDC019599 TaxID=3154690 RepID=UPI0033F982E2